MPKSLARFLAGALIIAGTAFADDFSFMGTFSYDTDVQFFTFTVLNPTPDVTLLTWSYGGGTNAAGDPIPSGGFEPVLSLFESDGTEMNPGTSGPCAGTPLAPDPVTGVCGDVYYPTSVSFPGGEWLPGTYTLAISLYSNPAAGPDLSDGFLQPLQGTPVPSNYSCEVGAPGVQGDPPTVPVTSPFCDEFLPGVERTGNWALDILNVDSAEELPAPEPGTAWLILPAGAALLARSRVRRSPGGNGGIS
jgi:hypothetical protein